MAFYIEGGVPLCGEVVAQGAKNAVLPMLCATLLCHEPVTLCGVPRIGDVSVLLECLSSLGVSVVWEGKNRVRLCAEAVSPPTAALYKAGELRASAYLLGASLSRFGEGTVPEPGGCAFGSRPLDYHAAGFRALGMRWESALGAIRVERENPAPAFFALPYPSVGATVNFILAALGVAGKSTLYGFAREGHVMDFINFLRTLGARITAEGSALHIEGGVPLHGGEYSILPDAIEAGTYLIAAAATGGEVSVKRSSDGELSPLLLAFGKMQIPFTLSGDTVTVLRGNRIRSTEIIAAPYPAFPTDLHPPMAALMSKGEGGSICDLVWHERFSYVGELQKMGLRAVLSPRTVSVTHSRLHGAEVVVPDLRGGAALVIAALMAEGRSTLTGEEKLLRGYEGISEKLCSLGAHITTL